jgi:hypothetical protein
MIYSIGGPERTFRVRHVKACPVAVEDGATAKGGVNFLLSRSAFLAHPGAGMEGRFRKHQARDFAGFQIVD